MSFLDVSEKTKPETNIVAWSENVRRQLGSSQNLEVLLVSGMDNLIEIPSSSHVVRWKESY